MTAVTAHSLSPVMDFLQKRNAFMSDILKSNQNTTLLICVFCTHTHTKKQTFTHTNALIKMFNLAVTKQLPNITNNNMHLENVRSRKFYYLRYLIVEYCELYTPMGFIVFSKIMLTVIKTGTGCCLNNV